jgi:DNA polymerase-3 subunit delta'
VTALLPWHEPLARRIEGLIEAGRLPHGILITGIDGWGDGILAAWLALRILGEDTSQNPRELAHPNLRWIVPDGAEIKVSAVRELGEFAFSTSQGGGAKVAVLESAHLLNRNAANALLKTLEEPPADTFLVLATSHPGRLPATIRSRCQRFVIHPDARAARGWLTGRWSEAELASRVPESGGAPLLVDAALTEGTRGLRECLEETLSAAQPLDNVTELLERDAGQVTGGWYRTLRDVIAGREQIGQLQHLDSKALFGFADELLWVRHQLVNTNSANARLLFERLIAKWHSLGTESARRPGNS